MSFTSLELRSLVTPDGELRLTLEDVPVGDPGPDEVILRVDAAPINPSDLGTLLGPADVTTFTADASSGRPVATAKIPPQAAAFAAPRIGKSLAMGNEGAGEVIAAGENARHLIGKVVGALGGSMFTRYRKVNADDVLAFPEGVTAKQGAAAFVNPLTALGMLSTMRLEGHSALVHTAAASNLGQMLNKLCLADGVELVNIVRSQDQAAILQAIGAKHILNSTDPDFHEQLIAAVSETGATLAFDAIGGGPLAGQILGAMEAALVAKTPPTTPYGSPVHKQVYVYGRLDRSPSVLPSSPGMAWGIGGWLLFYHLKRIGRAEELKLRQRVANEITTTFASPYTREITMTEALDPAVIRAYQRKATGEKFLLLPSQD
ncbi:NADH oxidoreductase [Kaistia sp. 32K]|uniref:zinc-binding dehydrogenase n=1 Tax=Kaistia sp. 32K TaxID=2795690 RepID=UPI00191574C4|nr:zinc-binding dehydrogenase [Kaistia sp. 32K]BCP52248.1 NADH oxidoreductase [Kaistia sp. 32K]